MTAHTTDLAALRAAVLASPDCDTVRLVLADALEEAGEVERAEFIRAQVWLWANPSCSGCTGEEWSRGKPCKECDRREEIRGKCAVALFAGRLWKEIAGEAALLIPDGARWDDHIHFARGLVHSVTCSPEDWLKHADTLAWHPSQTVRCEACWEYGQQWYDCKVCDNTGRIPRPCPPTGHPIREVTLTTEPTWGQNGWPVYPDGYRLEATEFYFDPWPGITFTLPPAPPEPEAPTIPLTGWQCRLSTDSFVPSHYYDLSSYIGERRSLELECRVDGGFNARDLIGQRFGPLTAVDQSGNFWSCEAILTESRMGVGGRLVHADLSATSITNPIRLG